MQGRIRDRFNLVVTKLALLLVLTVTLGACATKQQVALVSDPAAGPESALPWNRQEKWEGQGQFGGMAERMNAGSSRGR